MHRKIIHIDMDAFFAAVEMRDNPKLRGKAIAVGGSRKRGVVSTASYEARKYGVHSAMPSVIAARKCPHLIFVPPRFEAYKEASNIVMDIFRQYTGLVEPLSLDEAFLDVTQNSKNEQSATVLAREIKRKIYRKTDLTASAGVSFNKFLAKVASGMNKPNGITVVKPVDSEKFIRSLPIGKFFGVGKVNEEKLKAKNIHSGNDLLKLTKSQLMLDFGKFGEYLFNMARGIDDREVTPVRERKSIGAERTFEKDIFREEEMLEALFRVIDVLAGRMENKNLKGRTVTLKLKYTDFEQHTRSRTFDYFIYNRNELIQIGEELFRNPLPPYKGIRLLGMQISNLEDRDAANQAEQLRMGF